VAVWAPGGAAVVCAGAAGCWARAVMDGTRMAAVASATRKRLNMLRFHPGARSAPSNSLLYWILDEGGRGSDGQGEIRSEN
jgi:hypothetical protein